MGISLPSSKYGTSSYSFTVKFDLAILSSSLPDAVPKYCNSFLYSFGKTEMER